MGGVYSENRQFLFKIDESGGHQAAPRASLPACPTARKEPPKTKGPTVRKEPHGQKGTPTAKESHGQKGTP